PWPRTWRRRRRWRREGEAAGRQRAAGAAVRGGRSRAGGRAVGAVAPGGLAMTYEELVEDVARLERRSERPGGGLRPAQVEQGGGLATRVAANGPTVGEVITRELGQ